MAIVTDQYRVALRYVTALLDYAEENKLLDTIEKDFADLTAMMDKSDDLDKFIRSPLLSREQKVGVMLAIAKKAKLHKATQNFLALLASNRRLMALETILTIAIKQIAKRKGQITAHVNAAYALSAAETEALKKALKEGLGKDVALDLAEDEDLIGGMVVRIGSIMVDDSVRTKINRLNRRLKSGTVNISNEKEVA